MVIEGGNQHLNARIGRAPAIPDGHLWAVLAVLLTVGIAINWFIAVGLLAVFLLHVARPFDVTTALLLVVGGATFVKNSGTSVALTYQLGLLSLVVVLMVLCYLLSYSDRLVCIARTPLTWPLLLFMLWTTVNAARGVLTNGLRFLGLELFPMMGLGSAFLVANVFDRQRDLRFSIIGLIVIAFACGIYGAPGSGAHLHDISTYVMATPGIVALLLVNLALRAPNRRAAVLWLLLSLPLYVHQLLTLGRGLWTGGVAGLAYSFLVFAGLGRGSRARWARCGLVFGVMIGLALFGIAQAAMFLGRQDLLQDMGSRVTAATSTKVTYETRSNFTRLWEYATAIGQIRTSPWIGHGLGYVFMNKEPFSGKTFDQWYVHESYLMIWVKQGLVGVLLFLWTLWTAARLGAKEARRSTDPWVGAWFATTGAATVFLAVFSLSNFPFGVVNEMFLLAFLWGGSMAMTRTGFVVFRWRPPLAEMVEIPRAYGAPAPIDRPS